jgi:hypothetical protein
LLVASNCRRFAALQGKVRGRFQYETFLRGDVFSKSQFWVRRCAARERVQVRGAVRQLSAHPALGFAKESWTVECQLFGFYCSQGKTVNQESACAQSAHKESITTTKEQKKVL